MKFGFLGHTYKVHEMQTLSNIGLTEEFYITLYPRQEVLRTIYNWKLLTYKL